MTFDDEMDVFNCGYIPVFNVDGSEIVGWFVPDCTRLLYTPKKQNKNQNKNQNNLSPNYTYRKAS